MRPLLLALCLGALAAPLAADAWADAGALLSRGDAAGAARAYAAMGKQASPRREGWRRNNWGLALLRQNKPAAAVEQLELAVQADPRNFIARSNLGGAYERVGDRLKARDVYNRALELVRQDIQAMAHGRHSRLPDAASGEPQAETPAAAALAPEKAATLRGAALKKALEDASNLMDAGHYRQASAAYAAIGQTAPARREGWRLNNWALCALRLGEPRDAYARLKRAVEADPDNGTAWNNLAIACESLGLEDEARQAWGRSGQEAGERVDPLRFELARLKLDLAAERRRWEALTR